MSTAHGVGGARNCKGTSNKGHFGEDINSVDLFFAERLSERLSSLGGSKCVPNCKEEVFWDCQPCRL